VKPLWIGWTASTLAFVLLVVAVGISSQRGALGVLIDTRGRYSLARLQLVLWSLLVLPLIAGVFIARMTAKGIDPLEFEIPNEVLGVIGIAVTSGAIATAVKAHKDATRSAFIAASPPGRGTGALAQLFLVEEGPDGDRSIDLTKLQQLVITVFLVSAYAASAVHTFRGWGPPPPIVHPEDIKSLPGFNSTFLVLLGVSHAGYLAGKVPNRGEVPVDDSPGYALIQRRHNMATLPRQDRRAYVASLANQRLKRQVRDREAFAQAEAHRADADAASNRDGAITLLPDL